MRVLLLNPPYFRHYSRPQRSPAVTKSGTLYYPLWLAYAAGVLIRDQHDVLLLDAPAEDLDLEAVQDRSRSFQPQAVVVDTSTPSINNDIEVVRSLNSQHPDAFFVMVGTHVSALPEESLAMSDAVDAVARREYDYTVKDLVQVLSAGKPLETIQGLTFRRNGEVVSTPDRRLIDNLDDLPHVVDIFGRYLRSEWYFNPNALYPQVTMITSRGCPYNCSFCVFPQTMTGRGYRARSIDDVISELEKVPEIFPNAKAVFFEDDTFVVDRKRTRELCQAIIDSKFDLSWTANSRPDVDIETLRIMKRAGCRTLCVGFESAAGPVLESWKKHNTPERMLQFARDAHRVGIYLHGCFLFGGVEETPDTMEKTLNLAKQLPLDTAQFYPMMVYPGTEEYNRLCDLGYLKSQDFRQWLTTEGLHASVVDTPQVSGEDLTKFCDRARREFYLRPSYMARTLMRTAMHPKQISRTMKAFRTFVRHLAKPSI
jgi:anaerobic magnesium-protoporphyrin IX monomethyl ester cyclase